MDWLSKVASVLQVVRTPLSLGGLTVIVLCVIYNRVLSMPIFSTLDGSQTSGLLSALVGYVFWLAVIAVIAGVIGFIASPKAGQGRK